MMPFRFPRRGGGVARTPASLSEVSVWYERDDNTGLGTAGYAVTDKATQGSVANTGSQPTLARQPSNGANGYTFAGGQSILVGAGDADIEPTTEAIYLFKFEGMNNSTRQYFFEHWGTNNKLGIRIESSGVVECFISIDGASSASGLLAALDVTLGDENVMVWRFDGAGSNNAERLICRINGVQQTLSFSGTVPATLRTETGYVPCIGAFKQTGNPMAAGAISRFIICNSLPSEADLSFLESF